MKTPKELEKTLKAAEIHITEMRAQLKATKKAHNIFLHKISHDIKTPLNEIIESFHQLKMLNLDALATPHLISGHTACLQLDRLLEQLLTLDELYTQRTRINRTEFDLKKLLENHIAQLKIQAHEQEKTKQIKIQLQWHYSGKQLHTVIGDKEKINKIITELLLNAYEHTEKGHIQLSVQCLEETPIHLALHIQVSDTGHGMNQSQVDQIFTPFTHYADFFHGSCHKAGLSLMLCQKLTHLMSGQLEVSSTLGQGTIVSLKMGFPIARARESSHLHQKPQKTISQQTTSHPILIVDDNNVNRHILNAITCRLGFETQQACNGQEAIELCQTNEFALIFMDCQMPIMNGFEATQTLRTVYQSNVPIIAVTANNADEDIHQCLTAGMNDVIAKPVTPHKINDVLSRWLTHDRQHQRQ